MNTNVTYALPKRLLLAWRLLLAAALLPVLPACKRHPDPKVAETDSPASHEKRYPLRGEVLEVDVAKSTLRVRHETIEGLMPAMTMDFAVSAGDAKMAKAGMRIRGELVVEESGDYRLEKIWPADPLSTAKVETAARALAEETVIRGNKAYREVGEQAPEFVLYDQDGRAVDRGRFQGKQVMLNFIFTRCQVAKMCPAAVARFQQVQRLSKDAGVSNLELVSISMDPAYDTPGVLKEYATLRQIDTANYSFLTGPETAIKGLLSQLGILTEFRDGVLNHTATTLLIDENGRIVHRVDGSTWDVQEFVAKLRKA